MTKNVCGLTITTTIVPLHDEEVFYRMCGGKQSSTRYVEIVKWGTNSNGTLSSEERTIS